MAGWPEESVDKYKYIQNAIYYSSQLKQFVCSLCNSSTAETFDEKHIKDAEHKFRLKIFREHFSNLRDHVCCKECTSHYSWKSWKKHAQKHSILPWSLELNKEILPQVSKKKQNFEKIIKNQKTKILLKHAKKFYTNKVLKFEAGYYCYVCDTILIKEQDVFVHCKKKEHRLMKKGTSRYIPNDLPLELHKTLASLGITPDEKRTVKCRICNVGNLVTTDDVVQHLKDKEHIQKLSKFNKEFRKRVKAETLKTRTVSGCSKSEEDIPEATAKMNGDGPLSKKVIPSRPLLCEFHLDEDPSNATSSIPAKTWATIDDKIAENDNFISDFPQINSKKKNCPSSIVTASDESNDPGDLFESSETYIVDSSHILYKRTFGNKKNKKKSDKRSTKDPSFYCIICCCGIDDYNATFDHIYTEQHLESRRKYGCDNIMRAWTSKFYCIFCQRKINDLLKLYDHLLGKEHEVFHSCENSSQHSEEPRPSSAGAALSEEPRPSSAGTALSEDTTDFGASSTPDVDLPAEFDEACAPQKRQPYDFIVRQNAKKSFCQICDVREYPVPTKKIEEHVTGARHVTALKRYGCDQIILLEGDTYFCHCCDQVINNVQNVHLHVKDKKHMSSLIKNEDEFSVARGFQERERESVDGVQEIRLKNVLGSYIFQELQNRPESEDPSKPKLTLILDSIQEELSSFLDQIEDSKRSRYLNALNLDDLAKISIEQRGSFRRSCHICKLPTIYTNCEDFHAHIVKHVIAEFFPYEAADENEANNDPYWNCNSDSQVAGITNGIDGNSETAENSCNVLTSEELESLLAELVKLNQPEDPTKGENVKDKEKIKKNRSKSDGSESSGSEDSDSDTVKSKESTKESEINPLFDSSEWDGNKERRVARPLASVPKKEIVRSKEDPRLCAINVKKRTHRREFDPKEVRRLLNFDDDWIYELKEKLADTKLGLELTLPIDSEKIYCLICRTIVSLTTLQKYFEHLSSVDHCYYFEMMIADNDLFVVTPEQLSDLALAEEYMEEVSDEQVRCVLCETYIENEDRSLRDHIRDRDHAERAQNVKLTAMKNFAAMKKRLSCDWYGVEAYWCVPCRSILPNECTFVKHLKNKKHYKTMQRIQKPHIMDYCPDCAVLWFGYRSTYFYHIEQNEHKWLAKEKYYANFELPAEAKKLLVEAQTYVEEKIEYLDQTAALMNSKEDLLKRDLENIAKIKFPRAKAYLFGSRITGVGSDKSDVDIFLDCHNMYSGGDQSKLDYFMKLIHESLSNNPECWDVEELLTRCRSPIIRAYHRETELNCDISFNNGLAVENSKLIRAYNDVYPTCRKLILVLKQWMELCDLSGKDHITNYALYWFIIFFFQTQSILPSVATLVQESKSSKITAGWETGVNYNFSYYEPEGALSLTEHLRRFFTFYANFDFRFEVACPLIGDSILKQDFLDLYNLPKEMKLYRTYLGFSSKTEPFRVDSDMCIQDPFDLQHNLTKAVSKTCLNRFRSYCAKGCELLSSLDTIQL